MVWGTPNMTVKSLYLFCIRNLRSNNFKWFDFKQQINCLFSVLVHLFQFLFFLSPWFKLFEHCGVPGLNFSNHWTDNYEENGVGNVSVTVRRVLYIWKGVDGRGLGVVSRRKNTQPVPLPPPPPPVCGVRASVNYTTLRPNFVLLLCPRNRPDL